MLWRLCVFVGALAAVSSVRAQTAPAAFARADIPAIEDYGRLPAMDHVNLSPSGDRYVYIASVRGKRRIVIATIDNKMLDSIDAGEAKVEGLEWAGEDHLLISTSHTVTLGNDPLLDRSEMGSVTVVNVNTRKAFGIFQDAGQVRVAPEVEGRYGYAQIDGHWYAFVGAFTYEGHDPLVIRHDADGYAYPDLYKVDLDTGRFELVAHGQLSSVGWLVSPQGGVEAGVLWNNLTGQWTITATQRHDAVIATGKSAFSPAEVLGFGRTHDTALLQQDAEHGLTFEEVPLSGGAPTEIEAARGFDEILVDPNSRLWLGGVRPSDDREAELFDPNLQGKLKGALKAFDGYIAHLVSYSADLNRMIVKSEGGDDSGTYWIVDIAKHSADPLGVVYPTVTQTDVGPVRMIDYKAADGMALRGVLTLPPGREAKNLPLVVMPHGGPEERDYPGFDYWAQAFASRGYAVFQPNFRGSGGYGLAWVEAGYGQWGRKMQTDISDGVAELVRQGVVDPKRQCIVGWSYGGYAAQAGVTVQRGLYRCAVSMAGVADLGAMLDYSRQRSGYTSLTTRYWKRFIGVTSDWSDAQVGELSPIKLVSHADAPLLLIHGDQDTVVPINQSQAMAAALRAAGKPVEFVTLPDADHWLLEEDARVAMLKASVAFVLKYDPPDPAPTAVAAK
jgi:dienelactone hydrolase